MSEPERPIRVLLADDHPVVRAGICDALREAPDIEIVGEAADGVEAQRLVTALRPTVLLLDLVMPGLRAWEVEQWVRSHCADTAVVILTAHDRDCFLAQAVEARGGPESRFRASPAPFAGARRWGRSGRVSRCGSARCWGC